MDTIAISYRIRQGKRKPRVFDFVLDRTTGDLLSPPVENPPPWTALEFRQCSHCPLDKAQHSQCPVALQLYHIIEAFHDTTSIDEVELEVVTEERRISQTVPLQRAIGSMVGLVSPTCGCPKMAVMKPLARFHLPLSSEEETVFRVTGMYLLAQYLFGQDSRDLHGLKAIYDDLHILNKAIASRLRSATESDTSKNAIALLDMYSNLVPMMIDDELPDLKGLFSAYAAPAVSASAAPVVKPRSADDLALEQLMQEVPADELSALLGSGQDVVVKTADNPAQRPRGRAVFKLADD